MITNPYHFSHIVLYYWEKYNRPQNHDMRRHYAGRYDLYANMADDGTDTFPDAD
jgi:hypothetical protein